MSVCTDCKVEINASNGYKKAGTKGRFMSRCKKCFCDYCINRWRERKVKAIKDKGDKCHDCKQTYHFSVYDFHHLDPSKKDMAWDRAKMVSDERLKQELDKCILLCSNCHRLRHHGSIQLS